MAIVQFLQTSPEQLKEDIATELRKHLDKFLEHYKPQRPDEYLSRTEAANLLSVDLSTIHNWCKKGVLKPLQLGGRVYFLRSDISAKMQPLNN
jgi:excisionase family DNA binding protein